MFHTNSLLSEYGRECWARKKFWDKVGVPKKQRNKFAKWLGHSSAKEVWLENKDDFPSFLMECYEEYKKEKETMAKVDCSPSITLGTIPAGTMITSASTCANLCDNLYLLTENKEEETMDTTYEQRRYLENRLNQVNRDHEQSLRNHFHMDPQYPATLREAMDRIAKGTVKFPTAEQIEENGWELDGSFYSGAIFDSVDWRTDAADKEGFKAAEKLLGKAYTDAKDIIKVNDPKDGLVALKEFEAKSFVS